MTVTNNRITFNLIRELTLTDFKLKYQGSVVGYLWSFAKPLMLFAVLYIVFSEIIRFGDGIEHFPVYLLLGIVLWTYFTDTTTAAMTIIVDRSDLIRKIYFPRIILVVSSSLSALITLALNLVVMYVFLFVAGISITWIGLLVLLGLVLELYILAIGCALLLSALYVKFRDFKHIWEVLLQVIFYATPIIYPLNIVPNAVAPFLLLSPIAQIIQDARFALVTTQTITPVEVLSGWQLLIPYGLPFVVAIIGYLYFRKASPSFAEDL